MLAAVVGGCQGKDCENRTRPGRYLARWRVGDGDVRCSRRGIAPGRIFREPSGLSAWARFIGPTVAVQNHVPRSGFGRSDRRAQARLPASRGSSGPCSHCNRRDLPQVLLARPARSLDREAVQDRGDVARSVAQSVPFGRSPSRTARSNRTRSAVTVACLNRASSPRTGSPSSPHASAPDTPSHPRLVPVALHPDEPRDDRLDRGAGGRTISRQRPA